jgi:hypothetical protein
MQEMNSLTHSVWTCTVWTLPRSYDKDMRLSGMMQVFGRTKVREQLPVVMLTGAAMTPIPRITAD